MVSKTYISTKSIFLLASLAIFIFGSCRSDRPKDVEITAMPVKIQGQANWSFYGCDGLFRYENQLKAEPSLIINGCFSTVNEDGTVSLYRATNGLKPMPGCRRLSSVGWCHNGLIPVSGLKSRIEVIDSLGRKRFTLTPIDGVEIIESSAAFFDGLLMIVNADGKYGYVDTEGKIRIKPKYYAAENFSEGKAMVEIPGKKQSDRRLYRFIDTKGNTLFDIPPHLRLETFNFKYGRVVARTAKGEMGFVDSTGKFQNAIPEAIGIGQYDDDCYCYMTKAGKWGIVGFDGKKRFGEKYETIEILSDRSFLVQEQGGIYKVLDKNGIEKLDFSEYSYVKYSPFFGFICKIPGATVLLNKNGRQDCPYNLSKASLNRCASLYIRSDYDTFQSNIRPLARLLSPYGLGKYKIGMPCYAYLREEPSSYEGKSSFDISDVINDSKVVKYNINVVSDRRLVKLVPGRSSETSYVFDNDATIKMIQIDLDFADDSWNSCQMRFTRNLRNKGFSFVSSLKVNGLSFALYKAMENELIILTDDDNRHARIYLLRKADAQKLKAQILGNR